ncbi:MAG: DUF6325 family protein [Cellulomonas sp.]|nr:DUF6325 family protein [Cellulomonas sp.]
MEVLLIELAGDPLDERLWQLVDEHIDSERLRLLDIVLLRRDPHGVLQLIEAEDAPLVSGADPALTGLLGEDDLAEFAEQVAAGSNAVAVVVEHVWARSMAERLIQLDGRVLASHRIPAQVVNELIALSHHNEEE